VRESKSAFTFQRTQHRSPYPIVTLSEFFSFVFSDMPAKTGNSAKENLYPKITGTIALKWDISKGGKVFIWTADGPITVLGFSAVSQTLKYATKVQGADAEVRTLDEIHRCIDSCFL
jgi:hypothetical protein